MPNTTAQSPSNHDARAALSALADGDATSQEAALALWRNSADARSDWHAWHLAGDVMRSEDLAVAPARDADFLATLRTRLAAEPVPLAPTPMAPPPQRRRAPPWLSPVAAAAGVAAVAGVLVLTRTSLPGAGDAAAVVASVPAATGARPASMVVDGRMVYDPRYIAYLNAHRQGSSRWLQPSVVVPASATAPARDR